MKKSAINFEKGHQMGGLTMPHRIAMEKTTTAAGYVASISTAIGGALSLDNVALLIGVAVTITLGIIQWRVHVSRLKHDAEYHAMRMAQLQGSEYSEDEQST